MGSLSPCLTSSASSNFSKERYSTGCTAVEKIRQIGFSNKLKEQLRTLDDLQHPTTFPQDALYVNTALQGGWKQNLTPTPSPTPTLPSPHSEDAVVASERLGQALKETGRRIFRAGTDRLRVGKTSKANPLEQNRMIRRSKADGNTQFFQLNDHNYEELADCLATTIIYRHGPRSRTHRSRNTTKYHSGRGHPPRR